MQSQETPSHALFAVDGKNNQLLCLLTTLSSSTNDELRKSLENRLRRGSVLTGNGQVTLVDLGVEPSHCYFCLMNCAGGDNQQLLVCFITECNRGLDSYRSQLDQYVHEMEKALHSCKDVSQAGQMAKPYLEDWYSECLLFIVRCVKVLGKDIRYIIHNAVVNGQMYVDTDDDKFKKDVNRFHASCALPELLSTAKDDNAGETLIDLSSETAEEVKDSNVLEVTYRQKQISFNKTTCSEFCERWAQALLEKFSSSAISERNINPANLQSVSETYKVKTIQDMNMLKRMVKEAETDFYTLFKTRVFLKSTGNGELLLKHALIEEKEKDTLAVLKILQSCPN